MRHPCTSRLTSTYGETEASVRPDAALPAVLRAAGGALGARPRPVQEELNRFRLRESVREASRSASPSTARRPASSRGRIWPGSIWRFSTTRRGPSPGGRCGKRRSSAAQALRAWRVMGCRSRPLCRSLDLRAARSRAAGLCGRARPFAAGARPPGNLPPRLRPQGEVGRGSARWTPSTIYPLGASTPRSRPRRAPPPSTSRPGPFADERIDLGARFAGASTSPPTAGSCSWRTGPRRSTSPRAATRAGRLPGRLARLRPRRATRAEEGRGRGRAADARGRPARARLHATQPTEPTACSALAARCSGPREGGADRTPDSGAASPRRRWLGCYDPARDAAAADTRLGRAARDPPPRRERRLRLLAARLPAQGEAGEGVRPLALHRDGARAGRQAGAAAASRPTASAWPFPRSRAG